jgi:hypothetical protein
MARNSLCERAMMRSVSDAAFRILPPLVRLLFHELNAYGAAAAERGRIRFLGSVIKSVSTLLSLSETDVETGLETLASLEMLEVDTETNSIWMVGARANSAKAEAARINGKRGGRPPKNRPVDAAQRSMLLPVPGGLAETQETQTEPNAESSRAVVTTTSFKEGSSTAREEPAWFLLGREVCQAAGLDADEGGLDCEPVRGWLAAGRTRQGILSAVRAAASRPTYAAHRVKSLNFFTSIVEEQAHAGQVASGESVHERLAADAYSQAMRVWAANPTGMRPKREDFARSNAA